MYVILLIDVLEYKLMDTNYNIYPKKSKKKRSLYCIQLCVLELRALTIFFSGQLHMSFFFLLLQIMHRLHRQSMRTCLTPFGSGSAEEEIFVTWPIVYTNYTPGNNKDFIRRLRPGSSCRKRRRHGRMGMKFTISGE